MWSPRCTLSARVSPCTARTHSTTSGWVIIVTLRPSTWGLGPPEHHQPGHLHQHVPRQQATLGRRGVQAQHLQWSIYLKWFQSIK
jgi:hypothetical protein